VHSTEGDVQAGGLKLLRPKSMWLFRIRLNCTHEAGSKVSYLQLPVSMNLCWPADARIQCKQVQARMRTTTYL